jgi:hypothetical protein
MTTVNFVQNVGFHTENRTAITVDFGYFGQSDNGSLVEKQVTVPFLAMLPIPNLEVWQLCSHCSCVAAAPQLTRSPCLLPCACALVA